MANSTSDKPLVRNTIIGCAIAILVFHFAWSKQLFHNLGNAVFTVIDLVLVLLFIVQAIGAYKYADDPNKDWKRYLIIGLAVALCVWAGGWAAGYNERFDL